MPSYNNKVGNPLVANRCVFNCFDDDDDDDDEVTVGPFWTTC